jgi:hypothetical protein
MKCFRFWVRETKSIYIGESRRAIALLAGSNVSKDDASLNAEKIAASIEERIRNPKPRQAREEYEACIKEHIAHEVDAKNIITINRYGAQVLNTTQYTILDIDTFACTAPWLVRLIFRLKDRTKDSIVRTFKQRIARHPTLDMPFRIYETCAGIRIIGKRYLDPQGKGFLALMRALDVDPLYSLLCRKQDCYRARLTPKPYRMKMETIRIKTPLDCEAEAYGIWQTKYAEAAQRYSVVALLEVIGKDFRDDPVIMLHDQTANMRSDSPLA